MDGKELKNLRTEEQKNIKAEKSEVALREERILEFWKKNKIFEKSLEKPSPKGEFVFYDGPPFATGVPHYGHILPTTMKDVIPRYKTMKGYRVERVWGWDCHGLPIENIVEKELNLETKKDIETYGIDKFNKKAEKSVLRYADVWKDIIPRVGRWVDMEQDYKTMDWKYTESIWWAFKELYDKDLIYEGYKSMHICPRCETTLSNFEVTQGYKDIKDISITVKFQLLNESEKVVPSEVEGESTSPPLHEATEGQARTYILAWTTTPWTLPGNVALAVGPDIDYIILETETSEVDNLKKGEKIILAGDTETQIRVFGEPLHFGPIPHKGDLEWANVNYKGKGNVLFKNIKHIKAHDLIGKRYKPLFDYYSQKEDLENRENGWKIYEASFVNTEEGTGIVHIAPAFGADDMMLGKARNLPFVQHVAMDGKFKPEVTDFAGMLVKPKDDPQKTDIEVLKHLFARDLIFSKKKIEHPYPHCWRCETPLLNYAADSWFVAVTKIKDDLLKNNKKTTWVPKHMKDGRFGKWLQGARDWAISRARYWGAALPVWRCGACGKTKVIGSIEELKEAVPKSGNNYFIMRHGQSEANFKDQISSDIKENNLLTEKGRRQAKTTAQKLKGNSQARGIDFIITSPFLRTRQTAEIVAEEIGFPKEKIIFDERIREINSGKFDKGPAEDYRAFFGYETCSSSYLYFRSQLLKMTKRPPGGENLYDVRRRVMYFLYDIDKKYKNKNILIVAHEYPIWMLVAGSRGLNKEDSAKLKKMRGDFVELGTVQDLPFAPFPHNNDYELDLHRPYIDKIELPCECQKNSSDHVLMQRVEDVFDCWFESGSMPYASLHYPFENKKRFHKRFPADFIAEGVDQTRGWFYLLMVLSTALFGQPTFKNVVVNGMIMAEDGKKMSKRLGNYPEIGFVLDKYGADALRLFLMMSPAVRAEEVALSEKAIHEVKNKVINRLDNVISFYELYADKELSTFNFQSRFSFRKSRILDKQDLSGLSTSTNVLDMWILARLNETIREIEKGLEHYEFDKASRPIESFIDDLSTWYLRRSRERFKSDDKADIQAVLSVTQFVLLEFSKAIAPIIPFIAEDIYQKVKGDNCEESVHLEKWPKTVSSIWYMVSGMKRKEKKVLEKMKETRNIVEAALAARQKAGIKVRQPLQKLVTRSQALSAKFAELIKDEVNVKEVFFDSSIENEVELDTKITPELKQEGDFRELLRAVQNIRKKENLTPNDYIVLIIETGDEGKGLIDKFEDQFKKTVLAEEINFNLVSDGYEIKIDDLLFKIKIKK